MLPLGLVSSWLCFGSMVFCVFGLSMFASHAHQSRCTSGHYGHIKSIDTPAEGLNDCWTVAPSRSFYLSLTTSHLLPRRTRSSHRWNGQSWKVYCEPLQMRPRRIIIHKSHMASQPFQIRTMQLIAPDGCIKAIVLVASGNRDACILWCLRWKTQLSTNADWTPLLDVVVRGQSEKVVATVYSDRESMLNNNTAEYKNNYQLYIIIYIWQSKLNHLKTLLIDFKKIHKLFSKILVRSTTLQTSSPIFTWTPSLNKYTIQAIYN